MVVRVPTATPMPGRRRLIIIVVVVLAALLAGVHRALGVLRRRPVVPRGRASPTSSGPSCGPGCCSDSRSGSRSSCSCSRTCGSSAGSRPGTRPSHPSRRSSSATGCSSSRTCDGCCRCFALVIAFFVGLGVDDPVADLPALAERCRVDVREPRTAVRPRSGLLRVQPAVAAVHAGVAVLGAGRRDAAHGARPLPVGRDPAAGAGLRREGLAAGQGAPVGAARPHHAHEGVGVLPGAVRPADLDAGRGGRRLVHRRERAAAGASDPRVHRDRVRDPVPRQHPAPRMGAARDRGGAARARLDHRGCGLSRHSSSGSASRRRSSSGSNRSSWTTSRRREQAFELDGITSTLPAGRRRRHRARTSQANEATISNIRLWRPDVLRDNYISLQRFRSYYEFNDVDVDRYVIDGQRRVLMISTREVSQAGIPEGGQTWQNVHLVSTRTGSAPWRRR